MAQSRLIGLAAGASADGIDAALVELENDRRDDGAANAVIPYSCLVLAHQSVPYPKELRNLLVLNSAANQGTARELAAAHHLLGGALAAVARQLADQSSMSLQSVLAVGLLGHVAWHSAESQIPSSLMLGDPAIVAERTGLTTITDFRARDLACGGQGAPITAFADWQLFHHSSETRLLIHLGGITSVVLLPAGNDPRRAVGWEAGPGTVLLDGLMQEMTTGKEGIDAGGKYAVQGRQIPELLQRWLSHPFLLKRPPRSTQRAHFAQEFVRQTLELVQQKNWPMHDVLCTANHFIVRALTESVRRYGIQGLPIQRVILSGGGIRNGLLWRLLDEQLAGVKIDSCETFGVPAKAKEAVNAAQLAAFFLTGTAANLPSVTGATSSRILGSVTPGSFANWTRCLGKMTGHDVEVEDE